MLLLLVMVVVFPALAVVVELCAELLQLFSAHIHIPSQFALPGLDLCHLR